jgi:hypothetical protein
MIVTLGPVGAHDIADRLDAMVRAAVCDALRLPGIYRYRGLKMVIERALYSKSEKL